MFTWMELAQLTSYTLRAEIPNIGLSRGTSSPAAAALMKTLALIDDVTLGRWNQGFGRLTIVFGVSGEVACVQALASAETILRSHGYAVNDGCRSSAQLAVS